MSVFWPQSAQIFTSCRSKERKSHFFKHRHYYYTPRSYRTNVHIVVCVVVTQQKRTLTAGINAACDNHRVQWTHVVLHILQVKACEVPAYLDMTSYSRLPLLVQDLICSSVALQSAYNWASWRWCSPPSLCPLPRPAENDWWPRDRDSSVQ